MSSASESLLSMGFTSEQVTRATKAKPSADLSQLIDWISANGEKPLGEGEGEAEGEGDEEGAPGGEAEAKSLKCLECGKVFRNVALAEYHGTKSGHDQFEESTEEIAPLTEDQKAAKLEELRLKMVEKKKIQAKREAEETKANEAIRRKAGKDSAQIKADLALKEAEKAAAERKRDKIEEAKAKERVRLQIAADKKARADKAAKEKALREGGTVDVGAVASGAGAGHGGAGAEVKKSTAATTRLQIRVQGSAPLVWSGASESTLGEVEAWLRAQEAGQALGGAISFSSTYPRKTFGQADLVNTLTALGLAPSAVLTVA